MSQFPEEVRLDFEKSGLKDQVLLENEVHMVPPSDFARILGGSLANRVRMMVAFPYPSLNGSKSSIRYRLYSSELPDMKYFQSAGTDPRLYIPKSVTGELLRNSSVPLLLVEGEKKSLAAVQSGLGAVVGLGGVWSWSQNRKPIKDLDYLNFDGRKCLVAFDSDLFWEKKPEMRQAAYALAKELESRGAGVEFVAFPEASEGVKIGLDDYMLDHSSQDFFALPRIRISDAKFKGMQSWWRKWKDERAQAAIVETASTDARKYLTDLGNAKRLVAKFGHMIRFCQTEKVWKIWNGKLWAKDETSHIERLAKFCILDMCQESAKLTDDAQRRALMKHALDSQSDRSIRAMINIARSEEGIPVLAKDFDTDEWLLNCANGVLDLRTGLLKSHDAGLLISKIAPVEFHQDASCPKWDAFLDRIFSGNADLIKFMQRSVGYALTASTRDRCFFILFGGGANGKSTFLGTIMRLFGDYGMSASTETILERPKGSMTNDLARLSGSRFVSVSEAPSDRQINEALVKKIAGGEDKLTARLLYKENFDFKPTFKVFVATNHKPVIKGTDNAIWDRIKLVPFEVEIPGAERDPELPAKLAEELSGIFRWAVQGCLDWQASGLGVPAAVSDATNDYRQTMAETNLSDFIVDRLVVLEGACMSPVSATKLWQEYCEWCFERKEPDRLKRHAFVEQMKQQGFKQIRGTTGNMKGVYYWTGFGLRASESQKPPF